MYLQIGRDMSLNMDRVSYIKRYTETNEEGAEIPCIRFTDEQGAHVVRFREAKERDLMFSEVLRFIWCVAWNEV